MKIGFLTNALVEQAKRSGSDTFSTLDQVADWAADHGFTDLECGPMLPLDRAAYERHIKTPHFQKYKQGTLAMVRKLELLDQIPLIPEMKMK